MDKINQCQYCGGYHREACWRKPAVETEACISCSNVFPITETVTDDWGRPVCVPCFKDNEIKKAAFEAERTADPDYV